MEGGERRKRIISSDSTVKKYEKKMTM